MNKISKGSCLCGKIKFTIDCEFKSFFLCHCRYCQKDTGSSHAANLFSENALIIWDSGKENIKRFNLPFTRHVKSFCITCGAAVPTEVLNTNVLIVPAGCLETEIDIKPNGHLFISSKASWENNLEKIQKFEKLPE